MIDLGLEHMAEKDQGIEPVHRSSDLSSRAFLGLGLWKGEWLEKPSEECGARRISGLGLGDTVHATWIYLTCKPDLICPSTTTNFYNVYLFERQIIETEEEALRESFHLLVHTPNGHKSQNWLRPKSQA